MFKRNAISLCILTACSGLAYANTADLPQGERVRVGTATIERTTDKMTVNQSSKKYKLIGTALILVRIKKWNSNSRQRWRWHITVLPAETPVKFKAS
ncbi:hypothetical protein NDCJBJIB_01114 [Mannheimia haemolytica]